MYTHKLVLYLKFWRLPGFFHKKKLSMHGSKLTHLVEETSLQSSLGDGRVKESTLISAICLKTFFVSRKESYSFMSCFISLFPQSSKDLSADYYGQSLYTVLNIFRHEAKKVGNNNKLSDNIVWMFICLPIYVFVFETYSVIFFWLSSKRSSKN